MPYTTTISLTTRVDMQNEIEGFVHRKSMPAVRVTLADQSREHRFSSHGQEHTFTVTAQCDREREVRLEFVERSATQGAIEVLSLRVDGAPMGINIYQCEYTPYHSGETLRSHLYLGWPGLWRLRLPRPDLANGGFRFV